MGDFGGIGRIYYSSIATFAAQHGISGEYLTNFLTFFRALDDEYVAWVLERRKEQERSKGK